MYWPAWLANLSSRHTRSGPAHLDKLVGGQGEAEALNECRGQPLLTQVDGAQLQAVWAGGVTDVR